VLILEKHNCVVEIFYDKKSGGKNTHYYFLKNVSFGYHYWLLAFLFPAGSFHYEIDNRLASLLLM